MPPSKLGLIEAGTSGGIYDALAQLIADKQKADLLKQQEQERVERRGLEARSQSETERRNRRTEGQDDTRIGHEGERVKINVADLGLRTVASGREGEAHTAKMAEDKRRLGVIANLVKSNPGAVGDMVGARSVGINIEPDELRTAGEIGTRQGEQATAAQNAGLRAIADETTKRGLTADEARIAAQGGQTRQNIAASGAQDRLNIAARPDATASVNPEKAQEMASEALALARRLKTMAGKSGAVGFPDLRDPGSFGRLIPGRGGKAFEGSDAASYEEDLDRLRALLTTDNLGLLKGVLSDSDMKMLTAAATSLSARKRETSYDTELDRVIESLARRGGQAAPTVQREGSVSPLEQARIDAWFKANQQPPVIR